ncbi:hypothetical protein [Aliikangiella sp. IMCC44359]|uniref:hypothetical protein n=1 Tax=Aliikangiella sp. IMCC44359 TaxID=3459125 RepID=UPI00403AB419
MSDPVKAFLQNSGLEQTSFSANSRYSGIETAEWDNSNGLSVKYVKRRFISKPENFALLQEHLVEENDRLDNISTKYYSDPVLYWRICDANGAMKPDELIEETGSRIRITLPEGIPEPDEGIL